MVAMGVEGGWGVDRESGISRCKLVYREQEKDLLCGTGSYLQSLVINHQGREHKRIVYTHITESLRCTVVINTT